MSISVRCSALFVLIWPILSWQLQVLIWPIYHGSFKFKAKLGLGTVLLTSSYHSDSKNGSCNKLFTNWVLVPYQGIQALGFPNSLRKLGLYEKPWACISWYSPCTQLVNSKYKTVLNVSKIGVHTSNCCLKSELRNNWMKNWIVWTNPKYIYAKWGCSLANQTKPGKVWTHNVSMLWVNTINLSCVYLSPV